MHCVGIILYLSKIRTRYEDTSVLFTNAMIPVLTYPELPPQSSFLIVPIMLTAVTRVSPIDRAVL